MRVRRNPWRPIRLGITIAIIAGVVITSGILLGAYLLRDTNPIPEDMRPTLSFSPLVIPKEAEDVTTDGYLFSRAEDGTQILSYVIHFENAKVTVSEYVQPPEFSDIPEYKDRFLTNVIQQQETVQTANGAIYLGKLEKQDDQQVAVMLEKGLIVFMRPDTALDAVAWRKIGDQFSLVKN